MLPPKLFWHVSVRDPNITYVYCCTFQPTIDTVRMGLVPGKGGYHARRAVLPHELPHKHDRNIPRRWAYCLPKPTNWRSEHGYLLQRSRIKARDLHRVQRLLELSMNHTISMCLPSVAVSMAVAGRGGFENHHLEGSCWYLGIHKIWAASHFGA